MVFVKRRFEFDAAHFLPSHEGKCKNLHGHRYFLDVSITGPILGDGPSEGMVIDFGDLKQIIHSTIVNRYDHTCLNDFFHVPTAENMVNFIAEELEYILPKGVALFEVVLYETPDSCAIWRR